MINSKIHMTTRYTVWEKLTIWVPTLIIILLMAVVVYYFMVSNAGMPEKVANLGSRNPCLY